MRLNDFGSHMVSLMCRWPGIFVNPNYIRNGNIITWPARQRTDVAAYAVDFVEQLAEQRQYSLQILTDGSLIQLFYEFAADGKTLRAASLGFFYSGKLTEVSEELEPPLDEIDEVLPDSPADYFAGSWLRVDYDPAAARDCLHYDCHLHSSLSDDMRVAVNRVPTPKQFIELVLAWFYPETYRSNRLPAGEFQIATADADELFDEQLDVDPEFQELNGIHVRIPPLTLLRSLKILVSCR